MRCQKTIACVCLVAAWVFYAGASFAKPLQVLIVETMPIPVILEHERAFLEGLDQLGYEVGRDVIVDTIKGQGNVEHIKAELTDYLSRVRPDIVVSLATLASVVAHNALEGTGIPLVFCVVVDPVGAGLIKAVGEPTKNNVTGLVYSLQRRSKMELAMTLLTQPFPDRPVRIGVIYSDYPAAVDDMAKMRALASEDGRIQFVSYQLAYQPVPDKLEAMLVAARKGIAALSSTVDYWWIVPGPLGETAEFNRLLLATPIPVGLCHTAYCCQAGGLFFVGPDNRKDGRQVASMVDSILKGAFPGDIPPVSPDSFDMGVNLKTAIQLNIVVPSQYLQLAGTKVWR